MPVPLLDHLAGQPLGLQQRGDLVGVHGGRDAVGQFGGQPVDRVPPGIVTGPYQGEGVLVGRTTGAGALVDEAERQRVLLRAARFEGHGSAHPVALPTGAPPPAAANAGSAGDAAGAAPPNADSSR